MPCSRADRATQLLRHAILGRPSNVKVGNISGSKYVYIIANGNEEEYFNLLKCIAKIYSHV